MLLKWNRFCIKFEITQDGAHLLLQTIFHLLIVPVLKPDLQTVRNRLLWRLTLLLISSESLIPYPEYAHHKSHHLDPSFHQSSWGQWFPRTCPACHEPKLCLIHFYSPLPPNSTRNSPPCSLFGSSHFGSIPSLKRLWPSIYTLNDSMYSLLWYLQEYPRDNAHPHAWWFCFHRHKTTDYIVNENDHFTRHSGNTIPV